METNSKSWYYLELVNKRENGWSKIHKEVCRFMPKRENRIFLGFLSNIEDAIKEAEKYYPQKVDACIRCCRKE